MEMKFEQALLSRLWIYTNYDCNLRCSYCTVCSGPTAARREIPLSDFKRLIDEAGALGFQEVCLTGGEPFLLPSIFSMLEYALARLPTTILTNGTLINGKRMDMLQKFRGLPVALQVSIDSADPEINDYYRGKGSWQKAFKGLLTLRENGFQLKVGATATPLAEPAMDDLKALLSSLGIEEKNILIRPLARRGFSSEGQIYTRDCLAPEPTVNSQGVYWHPIGTDEELLVTTHIFPLEKALKKFSGFRASETKRYR